MKPLRCRRARLAGLSLLAGLLGLLATACSNQLGADSSFLLGRRTRESGAALRVDWIRDLTEPFGERYVPVEQAGPSIATSLGRLYIGSTRGVLWALDPSGKPMFRHVASDAIEAPATIDTVGGELYLATVTGEITALDAEDGTVRFRVALQEPLSQAGVLSKDALYLVTDDDTVIALSRKDGQILWRVRRPERPEGFAITGHAGLTLTERRLVAAFTDGVVVAFDASDGRVSWQLDTSLDLEDLEPTRRYLDVDSTPLLIGEEVFVASFSGGLYGIDLATGTVRHQESHLTGITGLATDGRVLIATSADHGVLCLELPELRPIWRRTVLRGAPGAPHVEAGYAYATESEGGLIALDLGNGREVGRIETAHGVTSAAVLERGRGYMLSNAGRLFAFRY